MSWQDLIEAVQSPTYRESRNLETPYSALFLVLQLHKPIFNKIDEAELLSCRTCDVRFHGDYPCSTVKMIQQELL